MFDRRSGGRDGPDFADDLETIPLDAPGILRPETYTVLTPSGGISPDLPLTVGDPIPTPSTLAIGGFMLAALAGRRRPC